MVYFDNASTAPLTAAVSEAVIASEMKYFGNTSSTHRAGVAAAVELERSRSVIAHKIGAKSEEIFFTSGATESNNWALKSSPPRIEKQRRHILISEIEHPSVLRTVEDLVANKLVDLSFIGVDSDGLISIAELKTKMNSKLALVSVIHGNNEIGVVQDIKGIGACCRESGVLLHTDATQSFCREKIDVVQDNIDLMSFNAHKIHGPKGIGALFIREGVELSSMMYGGGHEGGLRAGTVYVPSISGFAKAVEEMGAELELSTRRVRDRFMLKFQDKFPQAETIGSVEKRLYNNFSFRIPGIKGKILFKELNRKGIIVSMGSACSSTMVTASYVLRAVGLEDKECLEGIRVSFGRQNTFSEVDQAIDAIGEIVKTYG